MQLDVASICPIRSIEISMFLKKSEFVFFSQIWGLLCSVHRRVDFWLFLLHFCKQCHIWSDFIILDVLPHNRPQISGKQHNFTFSEKSKFRVNLWGKLKPHPIAYHLTIPFDQNDPKIKNPIFHEFPINSPIQPLVDGLFNPWAARSARSLQVAWRV